MRAAITMSLTMLVVAPGARHNRTRHELVVVSIMPGCRHRRRRGFMRIAWLRSAEAGAYEWKPGGEALPVMCTGLTAKWLNDSLGP